MSLTKEAVGILINERDNMIIEGTHRLSSAASHAENELERMKELGHAEAAEVMRKKLEIVREAVEQLDSDLADLETNEACEALDTWNDEIFGA